MELKLLYSEAPPASGGHTNVSYHDPLWMSPSYKLTAYKWGLNGALSPATF
jgi:hypothetical protein